MNELLQSWKCYGPLYFCFRGCYICSTMETEIVITNDAPDDGPAPAAVEAQSNAIEELADAVEQLAETVETQAEEAADQAAEQEQETLEARIAALEESYIRMQTAIDTAIVAAAAAEEIPETVPIEAETVVEPAGEMIEPIRVSWHEKMMLRLPRWMF